MVAGKRTQRVNDIGLAVNNDTLVPFATKAVDSAGSSGRCVASSGLEEEESDFGGVVGFDGENTSGGTKDVLRSKSE